MISTNTLRGALFVSAAAIAIILPTGSAYATNGYFSSGYGTASKGMAGAGATTMGMDTQAAATNPAAMRDVGTQMDISFAFFSPIREVKDLDTDNTGTLNINGTTSAESKSNMFAIPGFGYNRDLDSQSSIGLSLYANGGMNTDYKVGIFSSVANTGVDLAQMFMGLTYARDINDKLSVGITPKLAMQRFAATGFDNFKAVSSAQDHLSNNGNDFSYGYGMGFGATYDVNSQLTVGAAYHSRTYMTEFDKYKGLFAEQGDFDIPSNWSVGAAYKVNNKTTVSADFQRIKYGEVAAIANPIGCLASGCKLGNDDGAGYGWQDLDTFKLGVTHQYNDKLTLRAGFSHNDQNPYPDGEYAFNLTAPAVIRNHISVGATYKKDASSDFSFAFTHGLEETVSGVGGPASFNVGNPIEHTMYQWELEVAYTHRF